MKLLLLFASLILLVSPGAFGGPLGLSQLHGSKGSGQTDLGK